MTRGHPLASSHTTDSGVCMPAHTLSSGLWIMKTVLTYNAAMEASGKGQLQALQRVSRGQAMLLFPVGVAVLYTQSHLLSLPCCCQSSIQPSQRQAHRGSHRALAVPSWEHLLSCSPRTSLLWLGAYHLLKPTRVPGEETQLLESHPASQKEIKNRNLLG